MDILASYPYPVIVFVWSRKAYSYFERKRDMRFPAGSATFFVIQIDHRKDTTLPRMCTQGVFRGGEPWLVYYVDRDGGGGDGDVILPFLETRRLSKRSHASELVFFQPPREYADAIITESGGGGIHIILSRGDSSHRGIALLLEMMKDSGSEKVEEDLYELMKDPLAVDGLPEDCFVIFGGGDE